MYTCILVATGGSPWSDAAVTSAIALAACTGADLRVLTVLTMPSTYAVPDMIGGSDIVMEGIEAEGQALMAQTAARAASVGVPCETVCAWGNVPETILRTAADECCDLIVLGSRGLGGLKRLMLGSVANAVAAKAAQPVLIVKQPAVYSMPFGRRVLVATGGSPWSDAAVEHAIQLAQSQQLSICVLHVTRGQPQRGSEVTLEGKELLARAEARMAAAAVAYEGVQAYGDVVQAILETATRKQCDSIIMGSRGLTGWKRLMLGSISNAVTAKTRLPVLIVKRFFQG
jgi:nucleotide-binding universal stress UspA family protein